MKQTKLSQATKNFIASTIGMCRMALITGQLICIDAGVGLFRNPIQSQLEISLCLPIPNPSILHSPVNGPSQIFNSYSVVRISAVFSGGYFTFIIGRSVHIWAYLPMNALAHFHNDKLRWNLMCFMFLYLFRYFKWFTYSLNPVALQKKLLKNATNFEHTWYRYITILSISSTKNSHRRHLKGIFIPQKIIE